MIDVLTSKIPPLILNNRIFSESFFELLDQSESVDIATGYISADSVDELTRHIEKNRKPHVNLMIGMHKFEGITRTQYSSAHFLNDFLTQNKLGNVYVSTAFPFHGKIYCFNNQKKCFASIVGSSNLANLSPSHRSYELDVLLKDDLATSSLYDTLRGLRVKASDLFSDWEITEFSDSLLAII